VAFCNSCGATLDPAAQFCAKCGASTGTAASPSTSAAQNLPNPQASNGLKTVLIILAVVVAFGIVGVLAATFVGLRIARRTHVETSGENVRVETPFGTVESTKNPEEAAKNLGIAIYPGARSLTTNAASVNVGKMKTVSAEFETEDPAEKVYDFYKEKFPHANVAQANSGHYTIVSTDKKNVVTINIQTAGTKTHFQIANVTGVPTGKTDSDTSD
jgi:flagellar basal body-associated protein FliL